MSTDMSEYKELFISEVREYLNELNKLLISLEKDKMNNAIITEIFRLVHSIKGSSGIMGLSELSALAHAMEDVLSAIKEGKLKVTSNVIDLLLEGVDTIESMINAYEENKSYPHPTKLINALKKIIKSGQVEIRNPNSNFKETTQEKIFLLEVEVSKDCTSPKLRVFAVLKEVEERGILIRVDPDPAEMPKDVRDVRIYFMSSEEVITELSEAIKKMPEIYKYAIKEVSPEDIGIDPKELELLKSAKPSDEEVANLVKKIEEFIESEESATLEAGSDKDYVHKRIEEIKVKVKSLDKLFDLVGEMILVKSRLARIAKDLNKPELTNIISSFELIANMLQEEVMNMRLVPIGQVFNLLPRLVRDLAKELGKEVDLIIEGSDIALDRKILEEIVDPLMHIVRNAVDHGIESPQERISKGKPAVGTIRVSARREGNYVIIEVEDDGKGINPELVKKIAIERGLISPAAAEKMTDKEALMLITLPGFTTRNQSSQVSGRGMGMNVVKEKLESIGGILEISSKVGAGTKITMKLPPSLAVINAAIVRVGNERFAIPVASIERILNLKKEIIRSITGREVIYSNTKEIIPLCRLSKIFNINDSNERQAIIIKAEGGKYAVAVDYVEELNDIVVKPLGRLVKNTRGIAGATILGDGKICLILDPYALYTLANL